MTPRRSGATRPTAAQSAVRAIALIGGLLLLLLGMMMVSYGGPDRHQFGALAGAIGGIVIGRMRKAPRLKWYAVVGSLLGAALVIGLMSLLHELSQDVVSTWGFALLSGACVGLGAGLIVDARANGGQGRSEDAPGPDS